MQQKQRSFVIIQCKQKFLILKRSKTSNNPKQWGFVGGSSFNKKIKAKQLAKKEIKEEIGISLSKIKKIASIEKNDSIYNYYFVKLKKSKLLDIVLNSEHTSFKLVNSDKLLNKKNLHHSILTLIKNLDSCQI
jgi:8-oxo-dGTP pyrophosphatase MutT (NUDIX family)